MGAGDKPVDYDPEDDFESRPTRLDEIPPIPEAVPEQLTPQPETTGKHTTIQGYVDRERELASARTDQLEYDMMGLKLAMMDAGVHHLVAESEIDKLRRWMAVPENDRLIRVALRRAQYPGMPKQLRLITSFAELRQGMTVVDIACVCGRIHDCWPVKFLEGEDEDGTPGRLWLCDPACVVPPPGEVVGIDEDLVAAHRIFAVVDVEQLGNQRARRKADAR